MKVRGAHELALECSSYRVISPLLSIKVILRGDGAYNAHFFFYLQFMTVMFFYGFSFDLGT